MPSCRSRLVRLAFLSASLYFFVVVVMMAVRTHKVVGWSASLSETTRAVVYSPATVDAIRDGQFYIYSHPGALASVADRMGMAGLAERIRKMTYNEAERFVLKAIEHARNAYNKLKREQQIERTTKNRPDLL